MKQSLRRAVMGRRQTRVDVCRRSCIQLDLDHTLAAVDRLIHSDAWGMGVSGPENSETLPSFQGDLICGAVIEPDVPIRAGLHLLGHVLQRRDADLLLPLDQELNIDILAVGFRRIIDWLAVIGLKKKIQILAVHLIPPVLQPGEICIPQQLQPPLDAGVDPPIGLDVR